jgi:starch-binding outer membrane protein, SusD/RagB family
MRKPGLIIAFGLAVGGCGSLDVPDLNDPGLDEFQKNPTPASIAAAATGLLVQIREDIAATNGYVSHLGILGRESYNFDGADPRFITELLEGSLNPGNRVFGGHFWEIEYRNIRNVGILLAAVDAVVGLEPAQKEAVRGFAKTIAALEYLIVINTHDTNGAVIQMSSDPRVLDPISTKEQVFAHIKKLLDEAKTHLTAGGEAFPFMLGRGYAGFDTPANFLKANRALKARVDVYTGDNASALTALGESFLVVDPMNPNLRLGIYYAYSTNPGDTISRLNDPNLLVHPSVKAGAEMKQGGELDDRVTSKITTLEMERAVRGLTSDQAFTLYESPSALVPIIRNEELILLRAEASYQTNLAAAIADLNFIREKSGGLAPRADLTAANFLDELLKQRFYSLLYEGGHRWLDMRRHNRMTQLPNDRPMEDMMMMLPAHRIHERFPIPQNETDARMPTTMQ